MPANSFDAVTALTDDHLAALNHQGTPRPFESDVDAESREWDAGRNSPTVDAMCRFVADTDRDTAAIIRALFRVPDVEFFATING